MSADRWVKYCCFHMGKDLEQGWFELENGKLPPEVQKDVDEHGELFTMCEECAYEWMARKEGHWPTHVCEHSVATGYEPERFVLQNGAPPAWLLKKMRRGAFISLCEECSAVFKVWCELQNPPTLAYWTTACELEEAARKLQKARGKALKEEPATLVVA